MRKKTSSFVAEDASGRLEKLVEFSESSIRWNVKMLRRPGGHGLETAENVVAFQIERIV